jgi:nucleoside-diphosphate-sugar epimerase
MTGNKMNTVLITGATGFIGSNIAKSLTDKGYKVFATHRNNSSFYRCKDFKNLVHWINVENLDWKEENADIQIDLLIHTAWQGVSAGDRDNWKIQLSNFKFSKDIFEFAKSVNVKKIISLGSQAEYGIYNKKVDEEFTPVPVDAYGSVKLFTLYFLRNFATKEKVEWYWIRVFSVFGTNENKNWLLPSVILNLLQGKPVELTEGNQKYDFLHSDEFINNFSEIIKCDTNNSGIFNLCSGNATEIRDLLIKLTKFIPNTEQLLNFGTLPYRKNQNMFIVGDNQKFENTFGSIHLDTMDSNLQKTINLYNGK